MTIALIIASTFGGLSLFVVVRGWNIRRTRRQIVEHRLMLWREKERMTEASKMLEEPKKPQ